VNTKPDPSFSPLEAAVIALICLGIWYIIFHTTEIGGIL
jgi:hypothetical protein